MFTVYELGLNPKVCLSGHEFLEFEFRPDGKMRYANNSNYKNDTMIRKEVFVNEVILETFQKGRDTLNFFRAGNSRAIEENCKG